MMKIDPNVKCPATGFARSCRDINADCDCPKLVTIRGHDPQSGAEVDKVGCVDGFLPMLLIENTQQTRQAGAATESLRNEIVKAGQQNREALVRLATGATAPRLTG